MASNPVDDIDGSLSQAASLSDAKRILLEKFLRGSPPQPTAGIIPRRPPGALAPLSSWQQLLWLHSQLTPDLPVYNEPLTIHRKGPLDVGALERSLSEIIRRHEAWRTNFVSVDGEPVQVIQPPPGIMLPVADLRGLSEDEREAEALRLATEDASRPFDLAKGPLFRAKLVRLGDVEHRLYLTLHHIIFDDVGTYNVFLPELIALYDSFVRGEPSHLPELPIQYADYSYWQQQRLQGNELSAQMNYWRRQLSDLPILQLPTDRPRPPVESFRGSMHALGLSKNLSAALRALSRQEGVTLFMTLMAVFQNLLHRYSGQDDIAAGTVTANRGRPELEKMLGSFLNPLVLRTDFSGNPTFRELLRRVRDVTLGALAHSEVPFDCLVKELQPKRDLSRNPLYQVLFSLEPPMPPLNPAWDLSQIDIETGAAKFDLYLELDDRRDGIVGRFMYNSDLFDARSIVRLVGHWQTLLEGVVADPDRRLSQLPLLTAWERHRLSVRTNSVRPTNSFVSFSRKETAQSIPSRFESIVAEHGKQIAIRTAKRDWTYSNLNKLSNRIARIVLELVGEREQRVALLFNHDALMVAAIMGVLKAGKTYIPIDPLYPPERISFVLQDSRANALLTDDANLTLAGNLAKNSLFVINVDKLTSKASDADLGLLINPETPAYILYTSGSTGRPKGTIQNHRNVLTFIRNYTNEFHIRPEDRLSLIPSYSYDAAVMDIFAAMMNGACLCPFDVKRDGIDRLGGWLSAQGISIYHSTPTIYRYFIDSVGRKANLSRVRLVILGGEPVQKKDFEAFKKHFSEECLFANLSGQTESSFNLVYFLDNQATLSRNSVPMGYPVEDTEVLLLDESGQLTELRGEIGIKSAQVALGYWGQPELTRSVFFQDAESGEKRIYRTGDLGWLMPDGSIDFLGRKDFQVKIRGLRIELGEIEAVLARHPSVKETAAAVCEDASGEKHIVAYWVSKARPAPSGSELRAFLKEKLPAYMIPSSFVLLDALPLTPNGKLNRRALPVPEIGLDRGGSVFVGARDELEIQLAAIWEKVLKVRPIGIQDDFFALGGHSLLAVRLFALIEATFGKRIPLATLFKAPTIEQLAEVLREEGGSKQASSVVPIQHGGSLAPVFCVHGHFGEVLFYRPLSQCLGPEQPFYALQAQAQEGLPAHDSIETMAADYLTEIRRIQPQSPYFIAGFCLGAMVAFEMAQQLCAQDEMVAFLGLFVGYAPKLKFFTHFSNTIVLHLRRLRVMGARAELAELAKSLSGKVRSQLWRFTYKLFRHILPRSSSLFRNVPEMNLQAAKRYVPKTYPGRMTVFLSGEIPEGFSLNPKSVLDGMDAREIDLRIVPGDRDSMLQEPHVRVLAEQLKACLTNAAAPASREDQTSDNPDLASHR